MIVRELAELAVEGVSHDPSISKRVILGNHEIPAVTTFAQARFAPGQACIEHAHETMYEVYLVEHGVGTIVVNGCEISLVPGTSVVVEPGEQHFVRNPGPDELVLTYFGIAV